MKGKQNHDVVILISIVGVIIPIVMIGGIPRPWELSKQAWDRAKLPISAVVGILMFLLLLWGVSTDKTPEDRRAEILEELCKLNGWDG